MQYIKEQNLRDFQSWSGARFTIDTLEDNGDLGTIQEMLEEYMEDTGKLMTETEINDFLWFDKDSIAEWLGYEDWYTYCERRKQDRQSKTLVVE